jgi:hypothetical protein
LDGDLSRTEVVVDRGGRNFGRFSIERQVHDGYLHIPSYPSRQTEFNTLLSAYNGSMLGMGPAGTIPVGLIFEGQQVHQECVNFDMVRSVPACGTNSNGS